MGWMDLVVDPQIWVTVLAAVATFATVLTIALPFLTGDRLQARLKLVANRREELRAKQRQALQSKGKLRSTPVGFMKQTVDQLKLENLFASEALREKLITAGYRGQGPVVMLMFFQFALPIVFGLGAFVYLYAIDDMGYTGTTRLALTFGGVVFGYYAPSLFVQNLAKKRQEKIMKAFPDALDLLLICVESGMSIEAAFNRVQQEIGIQSVELAEEFGYTTAELSYLQDRRIAYENLGKRTGLPGVKAVSTSLIQAERYGTPLGKALRVMAQENRNLRMAAAEKKAAALPAQLTVPMIVFFLPVLFIVILGPAALRYMASSG